MNDELSQANTRGFELGRRHAALAAVIGQAALWARSFRVVTSDVLPDRSAFVTHPLMRHADHLVELWTCLGGACIDLAYSLEGDATAQGVPVQPPSDFGAVVKSTTYASGAGYAHALQSTSAHCTTLQDFWRTEVANASLYLSVAGIRTDELERYAATSQALFNEAWAVVREAYAFAVAATYGRIWAGVSDANEGRALIAWMKALVDGGFSFDECVSELRDLEVASPDAVACCLSCTNAWLREE